MKRIYIYSLLLLSVSLGSCKKFLSPLPTDFKSPETSYKDETDANIKLAGVYDVLGKTGTYGRLFFYDLDMSDEHFDFRTTTNVGLSFNNINASNVDVNTSWDLLYSGVNRANLFLENIDKVEMDAKKKGVMKGEAMFLRAYYYFLLSTHWGNVPLLLKSTQSVKDVNSRNTPAKEIFEFIVKDMETAAGLVDVSASYGYNSRITKTVVWSILARVNLKWAGAPLKQTEKFAEAKKWAALVMADGTHRLNPDYSNVFIKLAKDEYDTQYRETMWEIEFNKISGGQEEEGSVGVFNGIGNSDKAFGYSYGLSHATERYYRAFEALDNRRDWSISPYRYGTVNNVPNTKIAFTATELYNRFNAKFRREYETAVPKNLGTSPINFPVLRYADVLLMFAEAENEVNGPTAAAIDAVNLVRRRGYGMDLTGRVVKSIEVTNGGSGYTVAPTVTITSGGGTMPPTVAAVVSAGKVTRIDIISRGVMLTSTPTITILGGNGTSATAVATISSATEYELAAADIADKNEFRKAIMKERSLELGYEGLRKFDLIRWDKYLETMEAMSTEIRLNAPDSYKFAAVSFANVVERNLLLPIPSRELMLNKLIIQNKGW